MGRRQLKEGSPWTTVVLTLLSPECHLEVPRHRADWAHHASRRSQWAPLGAHLLLRQAKTPAYALVLPFLVRLYPRARYIVLTRHPAAIFSSYSASFFDNNDQEAVHFNPVLARYVPAIGGFLREPPARTAPSRNSRCSFFRMAARRRASST